VVAKGVIAIAQFAVAWSPVAQLGICIPSGRGQLVLRLTDRLAFWTR